MRLFVIKGLYYGKQGQEQNPTYYGKLEDCLKYVDNNFYHWAYKGENINVYTSNIKVATKSLVDKGDINDCYKDVGWEMTKKIIC